MKIAVIGAIHPDGLDVLRNYDANIIEINNPENFDLKKELNKIDGIILRTTNITNDILNNCTQLKIISRHGVGYNNVDLNYLNKRKIALAITGSSNAVSVAEHVMTFFLQLSKNIALSDYLVRKGDFNEKGKLPDFFELYKKNVLIFGFGRIGQAVAKRCLGFEMNVFFHDPFIDENLIKEQKCTAISKEEGLKIADFVSLHLPFNNETKDYIKESDFNLMKHSSILVNTARGGIVNENDLCKALQSNQIAGAGLDVFETEPPIKDHPLFELQNILLTPHNAALTLECRKRMAVESSENTVFFLKKNERLNYNNIVNRDILTT